MVENKTSELSGYELFKQQGMALKQKNHSNEVVERGSSDTRPTSVILSHSSIEGIVIEKKEDKPAIKKTYGLIPIQFRQTLQGRRLINNTSYIKAGELTLPKEVLDLIDNKNYLPRHNKLARDYGVSWLLKLSELARTKGKPSRWYATVCSRKNWEQTEKMLTELFKKLDMMKEKLAGIGVKESWLPYFVGVSSKMSESAFMRCIELANSRGVNKRPNLLAKATWKILNPDTA